LAGNSEKIKFLDEFWQAAPQKNKILRWVLAGS